MTANVAAVRVDGPETEATIEVRIPIVLGVHIPAARETRFYDLSEVSADALVAALEHGLSQRLGDAAAGKTAGSVEARAAVTKREKTLWADGRVSTDPLTSEMHRLACVVLKAGGAKAKELPTLKAFPAWMAEQDEAEVAKLKAAAESSLKAKAEALASLKALGVDISL